VDIITPRRSGPTASPVRWLSGRALRLHATLLVVGAGCLYAGWFELSRARAGNSLSWAYVFEWPFFAAFAAVIWWRTLHEDATKLADPAAPAPAAASTTVTSPANATAEPTATAPAASASGDEQLDAWQDYVARLNSEHPPGGPPPRKPRRA
jgi:hypothetical protein